MTPAVASEWSFAGLLQVGVVEDVHVTSALASEWSSPGLLSPFNVPQAVWRYIATRNGVVRVFPGVHVNKYFDARLRSWYQRALSRPGTVFVSRIDWYSPVGSPLNS